VAGQQSPRSGKMGGKIDTSNVKNALNKLQITVTIGNAINVILRVV